jgi:hypothetical protein
MKRTRVLAPMWTDAGEHIREEGPFPFSGPAWGATEENPGAHGGVLWVRIYADGSRREVNSNAGKEYGARYFWREIEEGAGQ